MLSRSKWSQNHTGDLDTDLYFDGTFKSTYTEGEFLTLEFNGTQIDVYGAKRGMSVEREEQTTRRTDLRRLRVDLKETTGSIR